MELKVVLLLAMLSCLTVHGDEAEKESFVNFAALESPFRAQKVNLLWNKARVKLTQLKLKQLHTELKVHDKEIMALKKLKAEGMDKEGLREAELRRNFNGIMFSYGLAKPSDEKKEDQAPSKAIFKDKKLDRLWHKANKVGLEDEELMLLKKEFQHHQEKLEQYHRLKELSVSSQDGNLRSNEIHLLDENAEDYNPNSLDGKAKALKEDYERLHRLSTNSQPFSEFSEPKVKALWRLAQEADFSFDELESLKQELHHYEKRLEKLHHLTAELKLVDERHDFDWDHGKTDGRKKMDRKLSKHVDTVDKLHAELASKIAARHSEL